MKVAIILCILLGFGLAGCGGSSGVSVAPSKSSDTPTTHDVTDHNLSSDDYYNWYITHINMPSGKTLTCVKAEANDEWPLSISCNWEAYNKGLTP